jgi:hypothetical protein
MCLTFEQAFATLILERLDLPAQRRLRPKYFLRCAADAARSATAAT